MKRVVTSISYVIGMMTLVMFLSFLVVYSAPNAFVGGGELNPQMTPEALERMAQIYGLNKSLTEQLGSWFSAILHGDFGISFVTGMSVGEMVLSRLPITLLMNSIALLLTLFLGIVLGIKAALSYNSRFDKILVNISLFSFSLPSFYIALLLLFLFAILFPLFPLSGTHSAGGAKEGLKMWLDVSWHLVLPIFVMILTGFGSLVLYIRSLTLDILKSDAIFFALSRGFSQKRIIYAYIIPALSPYLVTMMGLSLPGLIGGSVLLESLFGINGMGLLFYESALSRDYPTIMGIVLIGAFLTLIGNLIADLIMLKINPHFQK